MFGDDFISRVAMVLVDQVHFFSPVLEIEPRDTLPLSYISRHLNFEIESHSVAKSELQLVISCLNLQSPWDCECAVPCLV